MNKGWKCDIENEEVIPREYQFIHQFSISLHNELCKLFITKLATLRHYPKVVHALEMTWNWYPGYDTCFINGIEKLPKIKTQGVDLLAKEISLFLDFVILNFGTTYHIVIFPQCDLPGPLGL